MADLSKLWAELTEEEHQRVPGDWEAQVGQGPITFHSDEQLATSDAGVAILRSWLYLVGGATTGNAPQAKSYRARILPRPVTFPR